MLLLNCGYLHIREKFSGQNYSKCNREKYTVTTNSVCVFVFIIANNVRKILKIQYRVQYLTLKITKMTNL